jgi:hypothetical protein
MRSIGQWTPEPRCNSLKGAVRRRARCCRGFRHRASEGARTQSLASFTTASGVQLLISLGAGGHVQVDGGWWPCVPNWASLKAGASMESPYRTAEMLSKRGSVRTASLALRITTFGQCVKSSAHGGSEDSWGMQNCVQPTARRSEGAMWRIALRPPSCRHPSCPSRGNILRISPVMPPSSRSSW